MATKNAITESALSIAFILLLSITFLAPLYHSHDHDDFHHEGSADHVAFHDVSLHEGLSDGHSSATHLHILKDLGSVVRRTHSQYQESRQDIFIASISPALPEHLSCSRNSHIESAISRSHFRDSSSGLSPPSA